MLTSVMSAGRRRRSPGRVGCGLALSAAVLLAAAPAWLPARGSLGEQTERLLVEAVAAAAELDLYYARCRSDVSGRRTDDLNKELVGKFRITVLQVEDTLFPERAYRRVRERLEREFLAELERIGGCEKAKAAGMPNRLRERYDELLEEVERLP